MANSMSLMSGVAFGESRGREWDQNRCQDLIHQRSLANHLGPSWEPQDGSMSCLGP